MKNFILIALLLAPVASQGALLDDYIANQRKEEERRIIKEEIKRETQKQIQEEFQKEKSPIDWERLIKHE